MILCSCTRLTSKDVAQAVTQTFRNDPYAVITPGRLFHQTGRMVKCGRCVPLIQKAIASELVSHGRPDNRRPERK